MTKHALLLALMLCACNPATPGEPTPAEPTPTPQWSVQGHVLFFDNNVYNLRRFGSVSNGWTGVSLFAGAGENASWIYIAGTRMPDPQYAELKNAIAQAWNKDGKEEE